jgi:hypothetical protein
MAVFRDFRHKMPIRRNPQKSAILFFHAFSPCGKFVAKRPSPITVHDGYADAIWKEFRS